MIVLVRLIREDFRMVLTRTNKLVPKVITSVDTPNFSAVTIVAVLNTLEAKVMQKVIKPREVVTVHFHHVGQFIGLSGSSGPSHSMR